MEKEGGDLSKMSYSEPRDPFVYDGLTSLLDSKGAEIPYGPCAFVSNALQVKDYVKQAFDLLIDVGSKVKVKDTYGMGYFFDINGISVKVLDKPTFKAVYNINSKKEYNDLTLGFAFSKHYASWNFDQVAYVLEGNLFKVMKVIGHEIGHLVERPMINPVVEEAKAYAFEMAWGRVVQGNDIGGLRNTTIANLRMPNANPHAEAAMLVKEMVEAGYNPLDLFYEIGRLGALPDL